MGLAVKIRVGRQGLLPSFPGLVAADWSLSVCLCGYFFFVLFIFLSPEQKKNPRILLFLSVCIGQLSLLLKPSLHLPVPL